jgi:restriction system protein
MAIWLVRAGSHGEYEQKFIQEGRIYVAWENLNVDLAPLKEWSELIMALGKAYPDAKPKTIQNWTGQIWPFVHEMKMGDLVVLPLKTQPAIQIGQIIDGYHYEKNGPNPFYHWRSVKWLTDPVPRANFGQDLLYTFGAFLTICRVKRNNAETRIAAMQANNWKPESIATIVKAQTLTDNEEEIQAEPVNLEELGLDEIAKLISAHFKGHELTRLVEAILKAQGYTTYRSPAGADGGVDILAGGGPLGFNAPRLCVEVKSETAPIDRSTVDKLLGAISKFGADEGLFVSWSGFKTTVQKELAQSFFKIRLWSQKELLEQLFLNYDKLDEDLRAELPLKRIWTVAAQEEES